MTWLKTACEWLFRNAATLAVMLMIVTAVTAAVIKMVRDRRRGKSCCGDCAHCGNACGHREEDTASKGDSQ